MSDTSEAVEQKRGALGYGPAAALLVTVGTYFSAQILGSMLLSGIAPFFTGKGGRTDVWLEHSIGGQFLSVALIAGTMFGLIAAFLDARKTKWRAIGLIRPRLRDARYAVLGYLAYFLLLSLALQLAAKLLPGLNLKQEQDVLFNKDTTGGALWLVFISLAVLPPFVEEIAFRGFLYTGLRTKWPKVVAAVVTSVLFAVAHLQVGSGQALLWVAAMDTFVLSMVMIYVRERTGGLAASMSIHFIKNSLAFSYLFLLHK